MFQSLSSFIDNLTKPTTPPFSLADLPGFPFDEFQSNLSKYTEQEAWYSGERLQDELEIEGKKVDRYPVRINPIQNQVHKHTHFLFGEVKQDNRPLVYPRVKPEEDDESARERARNLETNLIQVWYESNGRAIQWENGAIAQKHGGCVFKLSWDKMDPMRTIPIRIENPHPKFFVGRPASNDMFRLKEAWIVTPIAWEEVSENGVTLDEGEDPWLIEHWTDRTYEAQVNGKPVSRFVNGQWIPVSGPNPWGFVPVVYIPHIRVGGFYGENDIDNVIGLIKELNLRIADYGDAVSADAHAYLGMRNTNGMPSVQKLAPSLYVVNLQSSLNFSGQGSNEPDLFAIRNAMASEAMGDLVNLLWQIYRRIANMPTVVDGEDEGSQRSGLTLAMRMLSLTAHTDTERIFWSTGLDLLNRMIIRMMRIKGIGNISDADLRLQIHEEWSPVLPRDREMVVQEAVALIAAKLGSPERLLAMLGVEDVAEERDLILKFWEEIQKIEAENAQKLGAGGPAPSGGAPAKAPSAQQNKSTE